MTRDEGVNLAGSRIFVVEDMALVAVEIERQLRGLGCEVVGPCSTVEGALEALREEPAIDVGLLDVNLSGKECYPIADALDERWIPYAFLTGYLPEHLPGRFGGIPKLQKPFSIRELQNLIRGLLAAAHREG